MHAWPDADTSRQQRVLVSHAPAGGTQQNRERAVTGVQGAHPAASVHGAVLVADDNDVSEGVANLQTWQKAHEDAAHLPRLDSTLGMATAAALRPRSPLSPSPCRNCCESRVVRMDAATSRSVSQSIGYLVVP